jgi:hypothetical protein
MTFNGSGPGDAHPVNTWSHDFSITVLFTGLDTFRITPGEWYDTRLVETYKDRLLPTAPRLFGDGAPRALLPAAVIIGYEPSIVLRLENSDYQRLKRRFQARLTASVDVGPFSIGTGPLSERSQASNVDYDDARSTISLAPAKDTLPVLLGLVSTRV